MLNAIKGTVKSTVSVLSDTHLVTSLGVRMRKPIDKNGMWIGWTAEEVAEHLASVSKYSISQSPVKEKEVAKPRPVSGGCGRS